MCSTCLRMRWNGAPCNLQPSCATTPVRLRPCDYARATTPVGAQARRAQSPTFCGVPQRVWWAHKTCTLHVGSAFGGRTKRARLPVRRRSVRRRVSCLFCYRWYAPARGRAAHTRALAGRGEKGEKGGGGRKEARGLRLGVDFGLPSTPKARGRGEARRERRGGAEKTPGSMTRLLPIRNTGSMARLHSRLDGPARASHPHCRLDGPPTLA